jgi:hydrogenase nickel incorporation protein HypB
MCTTCGCSSDARPRVTNLQTGEVSFVDDTVGALAHTPLAHTHQPHRHVHDHAHDHSHAQHGHDHDHAHHDHAHDHDHDHDHAHAHGHAHQGQDHTHAHQGHEHHRPAHQHRAASDHQLPSIVALEQSLLAKNDKLAERNRGWLAGRDILALNLMSSPGAGKTSLLERLLHDLQGELPMSVIEGDQETLNDAERIRATGCDVVQINTGTGCHLDAQMLSDGLRRLDPEIGSIVLIENVGNLVCPALFDLGEHCKIVIMSVTEGDDKPLKYPHMFRASELLVLNKIDLLPHVRFDVDRCVKAARRVNPAIEILQVSATRGDGMPALYDWIRARRRVG